MKRKLKFFFLAALLLTGCVNKPVTPPDPGPNGGDDDTEITDMTGDEYDAWSNTWSKPGHLYFHYNRGESANDYNNYCLWLWQFEPKSLEG